MLHDQLEQPSTWPNSRRFEYSKNTSTTSLRPHIEKYHLEEYKLLADKHNWKSLLPGLVSQARSTAAAQLDQSDNLKVKFDEHTFHQYLLNFIVADDQVCFSSSIFLCLSIAI
jgi:hypothetical protein